MRTPGNAGPHSFGKPGPLRRIIKQRGCALGGLPLGAKIDDRLAVWPKDVTVFGCVLGQHAAAEGPDLEAAHNMTVAVCTAHEAEINLSSNGQRPQFFG